MSRGADGSARADFYAIATPYGDEHPKDPPMNHVQRQTRLHRRDAVVTADLPAITVSAAQALDEIAAAVDHFGHVRQACLAEAARRFAAGVLFEIRTPLPGDEYVCTTYVPVTPYEQYLLDVTRVLTDEYGRADAAETVSGKAATLLDCYTEGVDLREAARRVNKSTRGGTRR